MQWTDAHVHIGEDTDSVSATYDEVAQLFEQGYLDKAVVFCFNEPEGIQYGNEQIRKIVEQDDRLTGLFRIDPAVHSPEDLRGVVEDDIRRSHRSANDVQTESGGFCGFKMHPRAQNFGMQEVYEHFEVIGDLGKPVIIHTGVGDDAHPGPVRAHPEEIMEAAALHEDTDIILAHNTKGYYFHAPDTFLTRFQELDNVYMDISLHCTPLGVETLVNDLGSEKILFASDYPYGHPVPMQNNIEFADISEAAAEDIAWRNAERLFF